MDGKSNGQEAAFRGGLSSGLTKREWLAGLAMQGLLANPECSQGFSAIAQDAKIAADALLAELAKEQA